MWDDMHFVWFSMWDGFFSPRVSESRPSRVATRVGFGDEWWEIHLTWKTIQNAFSRILYTLRHFNQAKYTVQSCRSWNHVRWIYLTTVLCMGECQKYARNDHYNITWLIICPYHMYNVTIVYRMYIQWPDTFGDRK